MIAEYTIEDNGYLLKLDNLKIKVPFQDKNTGLTISRQVMDLLIHRYNNEHLIFKYDGDVLTDEVIQKIYTGEIDFFKDVYLTLK